MSSASLGSRHFTRQLIGYFALLAIALVIILAVIAYGQSQAGDAGGPVTTVKTHGIDTLFHVLFTLAAVIGLGSVFGRMCRYIGQPPVIGEILAGLALGPSLLGAISPAAMHWLIPPASVDPGLTVASSLKVIAQLGVILYMFLVGLELNLDQLKHKAHSAVSISHASIVLPFTLGVILSLWLHNMVDPRKCRSYRSVCF